MGEKEVNDGPKDSIVTKPCTGVPERVKDLEVSTVIEGELNPFV